MAGLERRPRDEAPAPAAPDPGPVPGAWPAAAAAVARVRAARGEGPPGLVAEPPTKPAPRARRPPASPPRGAPTATFQALLLVAAAALSGFTILRGYNPHDENFCVVP